MTTKELAGCVIYNDKGELLLLHRNTTELVQWELPGGKIEPGEAAKDATIREIEEELKVAISIDRFIGSKSFESDTTKWNYSWFESHITSGKPVIGEPQTFDDLRYWNLESLAKRNDISPNLVNLLKVIL